MSENYSSNLPQQGDSERQLLVKILNVLGGSGTVASGGVLHGSGTPVDTGQPTTNGTLYINDSDITLWACSGRVWHQLV